MGIKLHSDIEEIRISEEEIAARLSALGAEIARDYEGKDLVLVGILTGATLFMADLVRQIGKQWWLAIVAFELFEGRVCQLHIAGAVSVQATRSPETARAIFFSRA